jgi:bifunctional enzyme CysN/CysC
MDLVSFESKVFVDIREAFLKGLKFLQEAKTEFIPLSALEGDNVVHLSKRLPWYEGPGLLSLLENVSVEEDRSSGDFRFPVQNVLRPNQDYRGYAGQVLSGSVRPGQQVVTLPSLQLTNITAVTFYDKMLDSAFPPSSVVLSLSHHIDLGRGDMLADPERKPATTRRFLASLVWMSHSPLRISAPYLVKHTTQTVCASMRVRHKTDISTLEPTECETLHLNEIGAVLVETHKPIFCDPYGVNRATGSFVVIDPVDNNTVGAGMISEACPSEDLGREDLSTLSQKDASRQHKGLAVWFTGLSGSGKSTICQSVHTELLARDFRVELLDGDVLRKQLNCDLGFSKRDRDENIRRIGFVAQLLVRNGVIVLVAAISPYRATRDEVRHRVGSFLEVFVNAPLNVCEERDQKGLYRKARAGTIRGFTGIDDPYEPPLTPDVRCDTDIETVKACTERVLKAVFDLYRVQGA